MAHKLMRRVQFLPHPFDADHARIGEARQCQHDMTIVT